MITGWYLESDKADLNEVKRIGEQLKQAEIKRLEAESASQEARRNLEQVKQRTRGAIQAADTGEEKLRTAKEHLARLEKLLSLESEASVAATKSLLESEGDAKNLDQCVKDAESALSKQPFVPTSVAIGNSRVAVGDQEGHVHVFDRVSGRPLDIHSDHDKAIRYLAFGKSDQLVSVDSTGRVVIRRLPQTWSRVIAFGDDGRISDRVLALAFSPNGELLASGGGLPARRGELHLWNVQTGRLVRKFEDVHSDTIQSLAFSPDGNLLVTGSSDQTIRMIDVASGQVVRTLEGHTGHVMGVAINAAGTLLASCGADRVVKLWDVSSGEQLRTYSGNFYRIGPFRGAVTSVSFIGETEHLICSSGDGTSRLLRTGIDRDIRVFKPDLPSPSYFHTVAGTPDNSYILTGDHNGVLQVWDAFKGNIVARAGSDDGSP